MRNNDDINKENVAEFVLEPLSTLPADLDPGSLGVSYTKSVVLVDGDGVLGTG